MNEKNFKGLISSIFENWDGSVVETLAVSHFLESFRAMESDKEKYFKKIYYDRKW